MTGIPHGARLWMARPTSTVQRLPPVVIYTLCVLIMLLVIGLQSYQFGRRVDYRDDEVRTVHAGMTMSIPQVVQWMSVDIHPPLWRVSATVWVSIFGPDEHITRFSSVLYALLALALCFRLARDLFDDRVALLAVFLLGLHALFFFYSRELRPYAALVMWTTAMHLFFLRWLRRPAFKYALLYVMAATGAFYTHFFALYVMAGQVLALFLLVRWDWKRYLRALSLPALACLAFTGWLPSFLHAFLIADLGGVDYGIIAELKTPQYVYNLLEMRPLAIGNLLLALAFFMPVGRLIAARSSGDASFRFPTAYRKWYLFIIVGTILLTALITSQWINVMTQRNLVVMIAPLMVLAAVGLAQLPWQAWLLVGLLVLNPAVTEFINYERDKPYKATWELVAPDYHDHAPVIFSVDRAAGRYFAYAYYLMDRMPGRVTQDDLFFLTLGNPASNLPEPLRNHIIDDSPPSLARFDALIDGQSQVFWITDRDSAPPYAATYHDILTARYDLRRSSTVPDTKYTPGGIVVEEFQRR